MNLPSTPPPAGTDSSLSFDLARTPIADGITLIEASAGTGKTYSLAALVVRLLAEGRVSSIGQILVVTFTNAAAGELAARIREGIRQAHLQLSGESPLREVWLEPLATAEAAERLRAALLEIDQLTVATIHGFCKQVLESHAFESGLLFDPELLEDDEALLVRVAEDLWRRHLYPESVDASLLAALAIWRGWTPTFFLEAWRALHRHPHTRLAPPPLPLDQALNELRVALQLLGRLFDRARLQLALGRLPFKDRALHSAGALAAWVDEVEACLRRGELAALPVLQRLRRSEIAKALRPGQQGLADQPFFQGCEDLFREAERVEHAFRAVLLRELDRALAQVKNTAGVLTFDDLLHRLEAALGNPELGPRLAQAVRRRYQVALIDEFQDTDLVQWRIFQRLFPRGPLFLIGDPKQAIYRFRGADIFAYLAAKESADQRYSLPQNWRSSAALVAAVQALFASPAPFVFAEIPLPRVTAAPSNATRRLIGAGDEAKPLEFWWLEQAGNAERAKATIARHLALGILELLESAPRRVEGDHERPLHAGDLAVLVRTNDEARLVQAELRRWAIPSVVANAGDIFRSEEMAELGRWMAAVVDPGDKSRLRAAVATLLWGGDTRELARLAADDRAFQQMGENFATYREIWRHHGFIAACEQLFDDRRVRQRFLAWVDGERRMTNLLHAAEVVHQAILDRRLSPTGAAFWLELECRKPRHDSQVSELRLESDARAVHIVTIHKSKGLEYDVVFCPFLWRTRRADKPVLAHLGAHDVVLDFGLAEDESFLRHRALADTERLAEDLRLLYVTLTRARHRCVVFWGQLGQPSRMAATALAWLLHRGQQRLEAWGLDQALAAAAAVEAAGGEILDRHEAWWSDLEDLCQEAPIGLRRLDPQELDLPPRRFADSTHDPADLRGRNLSDFRDRLPHWRITSFSSLSRGERRQPTPSEGVTPEPPGAAAAWAEPVADLLEFADPSWPRAALQEQEPTGLFAFARGPQAGNCLHEIFELCWTPEGPDAAATRDLVTKVLRRWGMAASSAHGGGPDYDPVAVVLTLLRRVLGCELPTAPAFSRANPDFRPFSLAEVGPTARWAEWSFHLPLDPLAPAHLAELFAEFADELPPHYATRISRLAEQPVRGFLKGFVDLLFCHQGRYFCLDWKSNHLGDDTLDYGLANLELAMVEHHYVLQYLIYTVAIHRHLRWTLPNYDYDQHWGGAYYLFLRGVATHPGVDLFAPPTTTGIYGARPSRALVEKLDLAITRGVGALA